jgi:glycosyltransferase involved in cell wall biosynthesis
LVEYPKLLYVGDVPVEHSYHGSALLFRLLQTYPPERLRIVEGLLGTSQPARRLADVQYLKLDVRGLRLLNTRLHSWIVAWLTATAADRARQFDAISEKFQPEAVITVAHGFSWLTAAALARRYHLPLHLIIHDDWPRVAKIHPMLSGYLHRKFGQVYRQAVSRFCVSPGMGEEYLRRYGHVSVVLYPSRAAGQSRFNGPPDRLANTNSPLRVVFAGTINSIGYVHALRLVADCLRPEGGQLLIFGPLSAEAAAQNLLCESNIRLCGLVSPSKLLDILRQEADVLFVPMSFAPEDELNMRFGFPSKLTDYTATGLPLLIYGPNYCSAVQWARQNSGVAEIVDVQSGEALRRALLNLKNNVPYRLQLAKNALDVGDAYFSHEIASRTFRGCLASKMPVASNNSVS